MLQVRFIPPPFELPKLLFSLFRKPVVVVRQRSALAVNSSPEASRFQENYTRLSCRSAARASSENFFGPSLAKNRRRWFRV
jgi:hypothetical protein